MFLDEVEERSARLIEGGQAMQRGGVDEEMAAVMLREGHTIKGTARVMGFEAMSDAGKMIEDLWRAVKAGDVEPYPNLGRALVTLAESLMPATEADPDSGSPEMNDAMEKLNQRKVALVLELGELRAYYSNAHPRITATEARLAEIKRLLKLYERQVSDSPSLP